MHTNAGINIQYFRRVIILVYEEFSRSELVRLRQKEK